MPRLKTFLFVILGLGLACPAPLAAQKLSDFAGAWTLNRQLSQFPSEIGFSADFLGAPGPDGTSQGGRAGRGRGGAGGGNRDGGFRGPRIQRESQEDAQRVLLLTDEVRMPFDHLTITQTAEAITITPDREPARTFHVGGKDEEVSLGRVMATVNTSFDAGRLVVLYMAETGRQLRYAYSLNASPKQLIVDVEFIERGGGDKVRRVYEPTPPASDTRTVRASEPSVAAARPAATAPATETAATLNQRPDAALIGLTQLGVVVEDLSADSVACGLKQDSLVTTVSKHLTDAGFRVIRNADDDTYLYVNVNTAKVSPGLCVSRYDVTLYTHTAARPSYAKSPVLLQVELLHRGGIAGGAPTAHADGTTKSILEYVDQFANGIRAANGVH